MNVVQNLITLARARIRTSQPTVQITIGLTKTCAEIDYLSSPLAQLILGNMNRSMALRGVRHNDQ